MNGAAGEKDSATARPLLAAMGLVAVAALPVFLTASLAPELDDDFAFGAAALGVSVGSFFAVSTITSVPAGRLVTHIGTAAAVRLTVVLASVCSLGVAALAASVPALIAVLVLGGLANAVSGPAASSLLARDLASGRQGAGYGALTAGGPAASLLAGLALPLVAQPFGWRVAFAIAALLSLLIWLLAGGEARAGAEPPPPPRASGARLQRRGWTAVHTLAVAAVLASAGVTGMIAFLVVYSIDSGLTKPEAGALLAAASLAAGASRIAFGVTADRIRDRAELHLVAIFVISSAGFVLLIGGTPATVIPGALIAAGLGWGWGGLLNLAAVRAGTHAPSEAVGIALGGIFAGAVIGPVLTGVLASGVGYAAAWALGAVLQLAAAATVRLAGRQMEADAPTPPAGGEERFPRRGARGLI